MAKKRKLAAKAAPTIAGVSQATMAKHLDVSQQRVAQFVKDEIFPTLPDGKLDKDECRVIYIRWLRDETRKSSASESSKRVLDARAREIELRTQRELKKLIEVEEVQAFLSETIGTLRTELAGVPAASSRDLQVRAEIENSLNAAIERCRASFDDAARRLDGGDPMSPDED